MKKSLIILFLIALIPFTDISAKRVRYFFNKVEISSGPDDIRSGRGTYIIELDTDNRTVVLKFKPNGAAKWDSSKMNIKDTGMYSESPGCDTKYYNLSDGTVLHITFDTKNKYTTLRIISNGKYIDFGRPTKVERF